MINYQKLTYGNNLSKYEELGLKNATVIRQIYIQEELENLLFYTILVEIVLFFFN